MHVVPKRQTIAEMEEDLKPQKPWPEAFTLEDHVRALLKRGHKSDDLEFQNLFSVFGKAKIVEIGKRVMEELGLPKKKK